MRFKVFISSVQREFAAERQMLAEYVRKDPLFRDRLEIMNPGTLPAGWTAETLLTTPESIPRNKVIAKALDWAGYVERSGHGTEFIIEKCEAQGLSTPQYKPDSALFHIVIWRKSEHKPVAHQVAYQKGQVKGTSLTPPMGEVVGGVVGGVAKESVTIMEKVFDFLAKQEMSKAELAKGLGWSRVYGGLSRSIKNLLSDGIIEYTIPEKPRSRLQKYRLTPKGRQMLSQKGR